jgi:hypothetical protein
MCPLCSPLASGRVGIKTVYPVCQKDTRMKVSQYGILKYFYFTANQESSRKRLAPVVDFWH